jgi:hypothetical protein
MPAGTPAALLQGSIILFKTARTTASSIMRELLAAVLDTSALYRRREERARQ